jgi:hypothetical protein
VNQLNTERLEKRRAINARIGFRLLPVLRAIFKARIYHLGHVVMRRN